MSVLTPRSAGLYVHVPFCVKKCNYCDFFSEKAQKDRVKGYLETLEQELKVLPTDFCPETVYLGGGTPSALEKDEFARIFDLLDRFLQKRGPSVMPEVVERCSAPFAMPEQTAQNTILHKRLREFSCEVNPGTVSLEKAGILQKSGVNRVSLGVQSLNDGVLSFLGRIHAKKDVFDAVNDLKMAKIANFSVDLMYGLPAEAEQVLEEDLVGLLELNPTHISCYCLTYEPGTWLEQCLSVGELTVCDDDECLRQYTKIRHFLSENGFEQYEISNFCRPGRACAHNQLYWSGGDYIGVGPAAHSFWKGRRYSNPADMVAWQREVLSHGALNQVEPELTAEQKARERLVFGLRMLAGVNLKEFERTTGYGISELCGRAVNELQAMGMLKLKGDCLYLTDKALFVSNSVLSELI